MTDRNRPGSHDRAAMRDAVALAQAIRDDRALEAKRLADIVLQRERERLAMVASRQMFRR